LEDLGMKGAVSERGRMKVLQLEREKVVFIGGDEL